MKNIDDHNKYFSLLTHEDKDFAEQLINDFHFTSYEICEHIYIFHNLALEESDYIFLDVDLRYDLIRKESRETLEENLKVLDGKLKEVIIKTTKGEMVVTDSLSLRRYFNWSINNLKIERQKYLKSEVGNVFDWIRDENIANLYYYLKKTTSLKDHTIRILIGRFLLHFKIVYYFPIRTEDEWNANPTSSQSYNHHLSERVRSLLKTILKKHSY
jgi:hypothetical protein